jgi:hypothetical protein
MQACPSKEGISRQVTSSNKGEPTNKPTTYPTIAQLVRDCQMKPSLNYQYRVDDLVLQNVIVIPLQESNDFLSPIDIKNLSVVNRLYNKVTRDVHLFWNLDFSIRLEPRIGYADQQAILQAHVNIDDVLWLASRNANKIPKGKERKREQKGTTNLASSFPAH